MNPVIVKNLKIGEGIPKICVPIVGTTLEEIVNEAKALSDIPKDLVEWRADWYGEVFDEEKVVTVLGILREIMGKTPILFTFRTAKEGGEREIADDKYKSLNCLAAGSGKVDLIDVEIFSEEKTVKSIITFSHEKKVKIIASNHDFKKTPEKEEIIKRLQKMQDMGADILKIAVMPQSKRDILTLLEATEEMVTNYANQPVVTMSMSGEGSISRVAGEIFGSSITFGSAKRVSAPGQISAKALKKVLEILHESLLI